MTRARDVSRLVTTPPNIYATDTEASSGYLSLSSASSTYVPQNNAMFAGKNKIINGDFGIWQRGTSNSSGVADTYLADRWKISFSGTPTTFSQSQQAFSAGTAPVAGYEAAFFHRIAVTTVGTATGVILMQPIEDVRTFAGQTVTLSFWAKGDSSRTPSSILLQQNFGSGGSGAVNTSVSSPTTITSSWTRYSYTFNLPSISGKTIGTSNYLLVYLAMPVASSSSFDSWGWQLEAGSVVTPFVPAGGGSVGAELALCQRYFESTRATSPIFGVQAITNGLNGLTFMVRKRASATVRVYSSVTNVLNTVNNGNGNVQTNITSVAAYIDSFAVQMSGTTSQMYTYYYEAEAEL
jgi:hypothetical protein